MIRNALCLTGSILLMLACSAATFAQDPLYLERGLKPFVSYHGGNIDQVSMANGNLIVRIPLLSYPQRGGKLRLNYFLQYTNKRYRIVSGCGAFGCGFGWAPNGAPGFEVVDPDKVNRELRTEQIGSSIVYFYSVRMGDGALHPMAKLSNGKHVSFDATGIQYDPTSQTFTDALGIRSDNLGSVREDPNGNKITVGTTDTLGRVIPSSVQTYTSQSAEWTQVLQGCTGPRAIVKVTVWQVPAPTGQTIIKFCQVNVPYKTKFSIGVPEAQGTFTDQIQSLVLPNQTAWTFEYDSRNPGDPPDINFADLTKIVFPTGGSLSYTWTTIGRCSSGYSRWVSARTLDANDGTGPHTWTYAWTSSSNFLQVNTVVDPSGNQTIHTMTGLGNNCGFYETRRQDYDAGGQLLRTVDTTYSWQNNPNASCASPTGLSSVVPTRVQTTLPTGIVTAVDRNYDTALAFFCQNGGSTTVPGRYGLLTNVREYAYGSGVVGALQRETVDDYLVLTNANYRNFNLLNLISSTRINDGAGVQRALTTYAYDAAALVSSGITTQHNSAPVNHPYRGNQTSVSRWLNTTGSFLSTANKYFDTGTIQEVKDPLLHTTTNEYSPSFAGAYLTKVTNALTQFGTFNYDFNSGLMTSYTDLNGQPTSYTYDNLLRLTQITNPTGGGQTTFCYTDTGGASCPQAPTPHKVAVTMQVTTAPLNQVLTAVVDGVGRPTQTQLNSDPDGVTYVDTTYDGAGRKATVSNPHRTASLPTDGITTTKYDAMGRVCVLVPPDGTAVPGNVCPSTAPTNDVFTSYSGNCTTVTDQAGKTRKSCTDALGRLIQVFEPNSSGSLVNETDYQYDTLDNLTRVDQKGNDANSANWRTRTFTYNSLSQLLTAANPESGSITYSYDNDGNLLTKLAPAPNQTGSATVTTTFSYDALHRLTQKSFSDTTPLVKYGYDAVAPSGCTPPTLAISNGIGRRTGMCDAAGAEAWSYDAMGRPLTDKRTTNIVTKTTSYTYNLDGSVATLTYPSGRMITYTYNAAARAVSAIDSVGPINYATAASYAPTGALASLTNGANLVGTFFYNNRLQPCRISVKSSGTAPTSCTDTATGNVLDFTYGFNAGTSNNGNVASITNNRNTARSQSFGYDELNRIKTAQTSSTTGQYCWGESFSYDIWANLLTIGAVTGYTGCTQENLSVTATTKNQISGDTYDSAGNLLSGPGMGPFTYDAENRLLTAGGVTYTYDGDGKRAKKSNGKLYWYGMSSDAITETDLSGTPNAEFIFFNGKRTARLDLPGAVVHYYFSDHLGSASIVTSATGTIQDESDYYPFGGERTVTNTDPNQYKFTGKERDGESGLDSFGPRYFGSSLGRFMSPDSTAYSSLANPQAWNLYAYTLNNPLKYNDPSGHTVECTTNAQQCKDALAAATANAEAAKRVTTNTETTKHSFLGIKWTTTKTTIAITGDISSFRQLSSNASKLADLVTDKRTFTFAVAPKYTSYQYAERDTPGGMSQTPSQEFNLPNGVTGAATVAPNPQDFAPEDRWGLLGGYPGPIPGANLAETAAHELLGHLWGEVFGGHVQGTVQNKQNAVMSENVVRATDPNRGTKVTEHGKQVIPNP